MKPDPAQTQLRDFQRVFAAAQKAQLHTLLVGGHSANFWAGHVFSPELGLTVNVPSPLSCLKAKAANVVRLSQETRQDVKHVRMLKLCNRGILRRALTALAAGQITDRAVVNALEAVFKFTQSRLASQAAEKFPFNWSRCFPFNELATTANHRVVRFVEHRLRRAFAQDWNPMASGDQNQPPNP